MLPAIAHAENSRLAGSAEAACVVQPEGPLTYPPRVLARKDFGTVQAELTFEAPDRAPQVKILDEGGSVAALVDAVIVHAKGLRMPCLAGDRPVKLRQDYVFVPNDGRKVMATQLVDERDAAREEKLRCVRHASGESRPEYPGLALDRSEQGKVLVRLSFTAADQPSGVEVLTYGGFHHLRDAVLDHVAGLRMPCLGSGEPVVAERIYDFRLEGGPRTVLRDVGLLEFLRAVDKLEPAFFDTNAMGCPFDLRVSYWQPYDANKVREIETTDPLRKPLLAWLSRLSLRLPERQRDALLGEESTMHVPCVKLDL